MLSQVEGPTFAALPIYDPSAIFAKQSVGRNFQSFRRPAEYVQFSSRADRCVPMCVSMKMLPREGRAPPSCLCVSGQTVVALRSS